MKPHDSLKSSPGSDCVILSAGDAGQTAKTLGLNAKKREKTELCARDVTSGISRSLGKTPLTESTSFNGGREAGGASQADRRRASPRDPAKDRHYFPTKRSGPRPPAAADNRALAIHGGIRGGRGRGGRRTGFNARDWCAQEQGGISLPNNNMDGEITLVLAFATGRHSMPR